MVVSNRNLLFQRSIFRGYVSFREGMLCNFSKKKPPTSELTTLHLSRLQNNKLWAETNFFLEMNQWIFLRFQSRQKIRRKKMTPYQIHQPEIDLLHYLFFWFNPKPPAEVFFKVENERKIWELHWYRFRGATSFAVWCAKLPRNCKWKCRNGTVVLEILEVNSQRSCGCNDCDSMSARKGHRWSWWHVTWKKRSIALFVGCFKRTKIPKHIIHRRLFERYPNGTGYHQFGWPHFERRQTWVGRWVFCWVSASGQVLC